MEAHIFSYTMSEVLFSPPGLLFAIILKIYIGESSADAAWHKRAGKEDAKERSDEHEHTGESLVK